MAEENMMEKKEKGNPDGWEKLSAFCKKWYLALIFFLLICGVSSKLLTEIYDNFLSFYADYFIDSYELSTYLLNYADGFSRRMLIGTLYQFLTGGVVSKEFILIANGVVLLMADLLVCIVLCRLVHAPQKKHHKIVTFVFALQLFVLPSMSILSGKFVGRLDVYMLLLSLFSILLLHVRKLKDFRYFLACLLQITAMLIHPGYAFTYYVPVFIALVWCVAEEDFSIKSIILSTILCVVPVVLIFFYLQYFTMIRYDSLEEYIEVLRYRTNGEFDVSMLALEYFYSMKEYRGYTPLEILGSRFPHLIWMAVKLFPFWGLLYLFWKKVFAYTKDKKKIMAYKLMHVAFLVYIPLCIMTIDYGRWATALCVGGAFNLYMLLYHKDRAVEKAMNEMYLLLRKYYALVILSFLYLATLPLFGIGL